MSQSQPSDEQGLAIMLNSIGDAVMATDAQGRVTRMNPSAERLTAWSLDEARGRPLTEVFRIVHAVTRLPAPDPVHLVMTQNRTIGLANHTVLLARDGREYHISDSAAPIRNATGGLLGVGLVFSDVTESYRTQAALQESERRYRSLLDNISTGVVVHATDTSILLSNPIAATLLGLTQDQLSGKTATDPEWSFLREDGTALPLAEYPVNRVLTSGQVVNNLLVGVRHPQPAEVTWLLGNAFPVRDEAGQLLNVVVTFTDITERKRAEEALVASEERWKFAIEGAGYGLWDWNVQTGLTFYSPIYKQMYGYVDADFGTTSEEWSKRIHPDDAHAVQRRQLEMDLGPGHGDGPRQGRQRPADDRYQQRYFRPQEGRRGPETPPEHAGTHRKHGASGQF